VAKRAAAEHDEEEGKSRAQLGPVVHTLRAGPPGSKCTLDI